MSLLCMIVTFVKFRAAIVTLNNMVIIQKIPIFVNIFFKKIISFSLSTNNECPNSGYTYGKGRIQNLTSGAWDIGTHQKSV